MIGRRELLLGSAAAVAAPSIARSAGADGAAQVLGFCRLLLQLVRHTATYSPPVAARSFALLGIGLWETVAAARGATSLAGQLTGFEAPPRPPLPSLDAALHGAFGTGLKGLFANTGPSGRQAMKVVEQRLRSELGTVDEASVSGGAAIMQHVLDWAASDGGATVGNLGFPEVARAPVEPSDWVPTSGVRLQQAALLPHWGANRPMALSSTAAFEAAPPHAYSEDESSAFFADGREVYEVSLRLTPAQQMIARYWSDDPMLTFTPPGHWLSILCQLADRDALPVEALADALARVGIGANDAFISCWSTKFRYNRLRPITYIRRCIDPKWQPLLITPPFPEYTSGHSCMSGALAEILARLFGADRPFDDGTHVREGLPERRFASFRAAAEEAALSRLYGGIHFRNANEQGLVQGRKVGLAVGALRTL
jgi:hypothetical protein